MGGLSGLFKRKKGPAPGQAAAPAQTQAPAAGMQAMASQLGNQGMIAAMGAQRPSTGGAGVNQALAQTMLSRLPAGQAAAGQEETAAPQQAGQNARQNREMAEMQQEPQMARTSLSDLYTTLRDSQRGGIHIHGGNSRLYEGVMSALGDINSAMNQSFTQDVKENMQLLIDMERRYRELITACAAYTSRNPSTTAGQHRKELVTQIQARASTDLVALSAIRTDFCSLPAQQQAGKGWNELLNQTRSIRLSVQDFASMNKADGGAASEVYKIGRNATVQNMDGSTSQHGDLQFFKPEDEYVQQDDYFMNEIRNYIARDKTEKKKLSKKDRDILLQWGSLGLAKARAEHPSGLSGGDDIVKDILNNTEGGAFGAAMTMDKVLSRHPKLSDKEKAMIKKWVNTKDASESKLPRGLSEAGKAVAASLADQAHSAATTSYTIRDLGLRGDEKVNMTRRNVATSRVAALLGVGNLVAKSETAEIYDEASGTVIRGNLMAKAEGVSPGKEFMAKNKMEKGADTLKVSATGGFQRDLCNLQVLDIICGQIDRHADNFYVSLNVNGELAGLQAIDNDASFGTEERLGTLMDAGRYDREVFSDDGEMTMPYMDKNMAERIESVDPEMIRFALKDLLKDKEIEAVVNRLNKTKAGIRKNRAERPERFLEDHQWNDDTAQEMVDLDWDAQGKFNTISDRMEQRKHLARGNYFGRLMNSGSAAAGSWNIGKGASPKIRRRRS